MGPARNGVRAAFGISGTSPTIPGPRSPTNSPSDPDIDRYFLDFRESAVRLAERVSDRNNGGSEDPVETTREELQLLRAIFGKWSPEVLLALHAAPAEGFESLRRNLPGISPRVLSLKLKELQEYGLVQRDVIDARPPRVRYTLTDRGWTVGWLTQPVLLYLKHTQTAVLARASGVDVAAPSQARTGAVTGIPPGGRRAPEGDEPPAGVIYSRRAPRSHAPG